MRKRRCQLDGCAKPHYGLGFCRTHYLHFKRWGNPLFWQSSVTLEEHYIERLDMRGPDECWPWKGSRAPRSGYGVLSTPVGKVLAHRFGYEYIIGSRIPKGDVVDHVCHNQALAAGTCKPGRCIHRTCQNPGHWEVVSRGENIARAAQAFRERQLTTGGIQ